MCKDGIQSSVLRKKHFKTLKEHFYDIFKKLIYISENNICKFSHFERWNLRTSAQIIVVLVLILELNNLCSSLKQCENLLKNG